MVRHMNSRWRLALLGLFVVSALLHFTALDWPHSVIFDEVHFGKFVTAYCCTHQRFFDIHPPVTKLLIAASAYVGGYKGDFDFDHIGEAYYPAWRWWRCALCRRWRGHCFRY